MYAYLNDNQTMSPKVNPDSLNFNSQLITQFGSQCILLFLNALEINVKRTVLFLTLTGFYFA